MALTNEDVFDLAKKALRKMAAERGNDFKFPFDMVWEYTGKDIPPGRKSHQAKALEKAGFVEKTGELTRAASVARASSNTTQYRFGREIVERQAKPKITPPTSSKVAPADLLLELKQRMEAEGYIISPAELANFFLAMMVSPLVILSGISGTGKSLLPRKFAEKTGATFHAIPVQPQWADNSDMFGYSPALTPNVFIEGRIVPALRDAMSNPHRLVIALLDEMNLAPVEHYFSDFLSVIESLRRGADNAPITDPLPIDLPAVSGDGPDPYAALRKMALPRNIRIVGTANMDETTKTFSPKVLDRAFAIEFDDPDLTAFAEPASGSPSAALSLLAELLVNENLPISVHEARPDNADLFDHVSSLLDDVQAILRPAGVRFGYRTRDTILLYLRNWKALGLQDILTENAALDFCLLQKILPKISGSGDALGDALEGLAKRLGSAASEPSPLGFNGPFERSRAKVERMRQLLLSDGATLYWGV